MWDAIAQKLEATLRDIAAGIPDPITAASEAVQEITKWKQHNPFSSDHDIVQIENLLTQPNLGIMFEQLRQEEKFLDSILKKISEYGKDRIFQALIIYLIMKGREEIIQPITEEVKSNLALPKPYE